MKFLNFASEESSWRFEWHFTIGCFLHPSLLSLDIGFQTNVNVIHNLWMSHRHINMNINRIETTIVKKIHKNRKNGPKVVSSIFEASLWLATDQLNEMISIQRIIVGQPFQKHGSKIGVKKFYPIRNLLHLSSKYRNEYNDWISNLSKNSFMVNIVTQ